MSWVWALASPGWAEGGVAEGARRPCLKGARLSFANLQILT